jgi:tetratricopeptide (TPR) repeat protein
MRVIRRILFIGLCILVGVVLAFAGFFGVQYWKSSSGDRVVLTMPPGNLLDRAKQGSDTQKAERPSGEPDAMSAALALEIEERLKATLGDKAPDRDSLAGIVDALHDAGETEAVSALQSGDAGPAMEALQRAISASERDAARYYRGVAALQATSNASAAIETYRAAIARDPSNETAWRNLADLLYQTGDKEGAADAYRHVLSTSSPPPTDQSPIATQPTPTLKPAEETTQEPPAEVEEPAEEVVTQTMPRPNPWRESIDEPIAQAEPQIVEPRVEDPISLPNPIETTEPEPEQKPEPKPEPEIAKPAPQPAPAHQPGPTTSGVGAELTDAAKSAENSGDWAKAEMLYRQALDKETEIGNRQGMANQYGNLGNLAISMGRLDEAEQLIEQSLAIETELNRQEGMSADYVSLGRLAMARGPWPVAISQKQKDISRRRSPSNKIEATLKASPASTEISAVSSLPEATSTKRRNTTRVPWRSKSPSAMKKEPPGPSAILATSRMPATSFRPLTAIINVLCCRRNPSAIGQAWQNNMPISAGSFTP